MNWTAVIPLRGSGERKARLSARFNRDERRKLSEAMFHHVAETLATCSEIAEIAVLSDERPPAWAGTLFPDRARGLNTELRQLAKRFGRKPLLVIHADLPLLLPGDVAALLDQAKGGLAIAPDRHVRGTNAVALPVPGFFRFEFGPDSYARHIAHANGPIHTVIRPGLATDCDTPEDYDFAFSLGAALPWAGGT